MDKVLEDNTDFTWEDETWEVINSYFNQKQNQLVKHQIESFDEFMSTKTQGIVTQYNPIIIYHDFDVDTKLYKYLVEVNFGKIYFSKPTIHENNGSTKTMIPNEARLRNFTYAAPMYVDIKFTINVRKGKNFNPESEKVITLKKINIGKMPIMLQSKFCLLRERNSLTKKELGECDQCSGGYFIINGSEKVLVSQEKVAENKVYVFKNNKNASKYSHVVEIKSVSTNKFTPAKSINIKLSSKSTMFGKTIKVTIPHVRQDIPLFVLFRALGIESDKEIIEHIVFDIDASSSSKIIALLKPSLEEAINIQTQEFALEYISKYISIMGHPKEIKIEKEKKIGHVKDLLHKEYLPHIGSSIVKKSIFTGYMVRKLLLCYMGYIDFDDRDSYVNKRIDLPGTLLANLFRQYFTKLIKDMRSAIIKELNTGPWKATNNYGDLINNSNIYKILKSTTIETGLRYSLATGNWGMKNATNKQGIAQVLSRLTYNSTLSHLRRVNTPIEKTGKLIAPRKLHNTSWGILCPAETPEGGAVGVVKNLAITTNITIDADAEPVYNAVNELEIQKIENIELNELNKNTKIFINGDWYCMFHDPIIMLDHLRHLRRTGILNVYTSISWDSFLNELYVFTDGGRCCRPLYILDNNKFRIKKSHIDKLKNKEIFWNNLLVSSLNENNDFESNDIEEGVIEFIDSQEANGCLIAIPENNKIIGVKDNNILRYTHSEIHPCTILGVLASCIPFPDHNQSPRNTYQSAMGKQAMGIYATNFRQRLDTLAHVLNYPQKPLVNTKIMKYLNCDEMPNGMNVVVAVATYSGYNQEDSIILNKSSVDRGLFRSTFYRTYKDEEKKNQADGADEKFCKPQKSYTNGMKPGSYEKLDEDGFVTINTPVKSNDVIIGKVIPTKQSNNMENTSKFRDNSTSIRNNEEGVVDHVYHNRNGEGYRFCKVRIRSERIPSIGDKFSSRHGQKGTVGMLYRQENMPFSKDGIVPDIIINPHAIPSRMTIAQLIECIMGKTCANLGSFGDATPFTNTSIDTISDVLENCGFERNGNEIMYNGMTGEQLQTEFFIGPTYYQRLKHMVDDKIHSRSTGPVVLLTRQPAEGRARDGGLRFGEMERDCIIAHGSSQFLKERMLDVSDNYRMFVCKECGLTGVVNEERNIYFCKGCDNYINFAEIHLPYACKLMLQELQTMNIAPRIISE
jgi:DNA-directed RNA polymerase II subunit RPB2